MKLPCEECTKTNNSCCKADIPYGLLDALHIKYLLTQKYKVLKPSQILMHPHPNDEPNQYMIINCTDIKRDDEVDIREHNCVALIEGRCAIYEDRPSICRQYGTEFARCRFECAGISSYEDIAKCTVEDIKTLDKLAFGLSKANEINPYDKE